ncbi:hypothetical protein E2C01_089905 [Portunus trituberculatus]|uniref:Uncharacterized protein n=1 Tax=Portunus trituberculatus TaxID=210409 RepID=A0A5B7JQV6_PORTR|nr:hypothetical protein [Portunus trituberculatus]
MNSKAPSSSLQTSVCDLGMLQSSLPTAISFLPASEDEPPLMRTCAVETRSSRMKIATLGRLYFVTFAVPDFSLPEVFDLETSNKGW